MRVAKAAKAVTANRYLESCGCNSRNCQESHRQLLEECRKVEWNAEYSLC